MSENDSFFILVKSMVLTWTNGFVEHPDYDHQREVSLLRMFIYKSSLRNDFLKTPKQSLTCFRLGELKLRPGQASHHLQVFYLNQISASLNQISVTQSDSEDS